MADDMSQGQNQNQDTSEGGEQIAGGQEQENI